MRLENVRSAALAAAMWWCAALPAHSLTPAQEGALVFEGVKDLSASVEQILMQSCYLTAGHANGYAEGISEDITVFETTTLSLREGDPDTGVEGIKSRGTLFALTSAEERWVNFSDFARFATRGAMSEPYFVRMYDLHTPLLSDLKSVSDRISAKYAGARISAWTSATLINLADMRTDATLLATYHCMLAEDMRPEDARAKLRLQREKLLADVAIAISGASDAQLHEASDNKRVYLECVIATIEALDRFMEPALQDGYRPSDAELIEAKDYMRELLRVTEGALSVFFAEMAGEQISATGCA